jgi:hypothetical protein
MHFTQVYYGFTVVIMPVDSHTDTRTPPRWAVTVFVPYR